MSARRSLEGQVAVVTGAARGVGELLARKLSARGAKVALVGLEPETLKEVSERLHTDSDHWHADVTDHEAMARVAQEVKERFGKVDIVVANAGVAAAWAVRRLRPRRLAPGDRGQPDRRGRHRPRLPPRTHREPRLLPADRLARRDPHAAPMMTAYCASKSGVEAFAHCLRAEVGYKGVKVGVGYLSWTDTDMVRGADQDEVMRELRRMAALAVEPDVPAGPGRGPDREAGIERRSPHVYAQWWLRGMQGVRGYLPGIIATVGQREMKRFEPRLTSVSRGLVGAGGAADEKERTQGTGRH